MVRTESNLLLINLGDTTACRANTGNSRLYRVMEGKKVTDNPKLQLKKKAVKTQYKMDLMQISLVKETSHIQEQTIQQTSKSVKTWYHNKRLQKFRNTKQAAGTKKSVATA
jgi:hypothetical protein